MTFVSWATGVFGIVEVGRSHKSRKDGHKYETDEASDERQVKSAHCGRACGQRIMNNVPHALVHDTAKGLDAGT